MLQPNSRFSRNSTLTPRSKYNAASTIMGYRLDHLGGLELERVKNFVFSILARV
jgi:hypothetical protein